MSMLGVSSLTLHAAGAVVFHACYAVRYPAMHTSPVDMHIIWSPMAGLLTMMVGGFGGHAIETQEGRIIGMLKGFC